MDRTNWRGMGVQISTCVLRRSRCL
ncbi:hypothetical protein PMIN01_01833 [Paraphaeosphaeria minitans]|uniref:Uncharacterized protein n=1 Tax=Paraphaeosphaeria minitans TaxID=565426 RepID=A0A9P6GPJ0_9PLEO|nr:hypothetical protein PMIN01_01833 [Paraphaeosphaeria minitans]